MTFIAHDFTKKTKQVLKHCQQSATKDITSWMKLLRKTIIPFEKITIKMKIHMKRTKQTFIKTAAKM